MTIHPEQPTDPHGANVLLTKEGSVLLQLRDNKPSISFPAYWALPGGKVEKGESPESAARRELFEECGYKMVGPQLVFSQTVTKDNGLTIKEFVFSEEYDQSQFIQCYEGQEMKFFPKDQINQLRVVPWQKELIDQLLLDNPAFKSKINKE